MINGGTNATLLNYNYYKINLNSRVSFQLEKYLYKELNQIDTIVKCLIQCSLEETCLMIQFDIMGKVCSFLKAIYNDTFSTIPYDNSIIYEKSFKIGNLLVLS